jgi:hypothetical protein
MACAGACRAPWTLRRAGSRPASRLGVRWLGGRRRWPSWVLGGHRHVERHDHGEQRPGVVRAVGQFHLHQVAEACQGCGDGEAVSAQPAEFEAAGGEPAVAVGDDGGLVVQHPPWLACWYDHPALLGQVRVFGLRLALPAIAQWLLGLVASNISSTSVNPPSRLTMAVSCCLQRAGSAYAGREPAYRGQPARCGTGGLAASDGAGMDPAGRPVPRDPAGRGDLSLVRNPPGSPGDHPRGRGDYRLRLVRERPTAGPPPRARGLLRHLG